MVSDGEDMDGEAGGGRVAAAGTLFLEHVVVYRELLGDAAVERGLAAVAPEVRRAYESCVPGAGIDVGVSVQLYSAIAEAAGRDVVELHAEAIRIGYTRALTGLWRALMLRMATDRAIVSRAPMLFAKTFTGGSMEGELQAPGRAVFHIRGWPSMPALHRVGICGGMQAVLELSGRRDVQIDSVETSDGARYVCTWS